MSSCSTCGTSACDEMSMQRFRPWSVLVRFWEDAAKTIPRDVSASTFAAEMKVGAVTQDININTTDAALGEITLFLTAAETGEFPNVKNGEWDLEETIAGVPSTAIPTQRVHVSTPVTVP